MAAKPEVQADVSDQELDSPKQNQNNQKLTKKPQSQNQPQAKEEPEKEQFRTVQQQEKYENYLKQKRREDGLQSNRSRSASRRARRKRIQDGIEGGKYMKTASLEALEEADASGELNQMGMFERIGPDSTSMDGPVTKARAMRGEIPMRGTDPNQPYQMEKQSRMDESEGLKLTLEANLDIEIELKASIRGDLTLSLFS